MPLFPFSFSVFIFRPLQLPDNCLDVKEGANQPPSIQKNILSAALNSGLPGLKKGGAILSGLRFKGQKRRQQKVADQLKPVDPAAPAQSDSAAKETAKTPDPQPEVVSKDYRSLYSTYMGDCVLVHWQLLLPAKAEDDGPLLPHQSGIRVGADWRTSVIDAEATDDQTEEAEAVAGQHFLNSPQPQLLMIPPQGGGVFWVLFRDLANNQDLTSASHASAKAVFFFRPRLGLNIEKLHFIMISRLHSFHSVWKGGWTEFVDWPHQCLADAHNI
ncbi:unnamed protein product [Protopolystoma xenopodis]|uniref:Uncharacterized protein n=1 Tax=Protopolystoma xenopodis TaxID=117903 RepID=A0A448XKK2_9PLAT|nr:unnamed protein product [Protopolystoma xenopodis]